MRILGLLLVVGCWLSAPAPAPVANTKPPPPVTRSGRLRLISIKPAYGSSDGGTYVRIEGQDFIADGPRDVKVYFGSRQGAVVRVVDDHELIVEAPGGNQNETVDVLVMFAPGGESKLPAAFTFVTTTP